VPFDRPRLMEQGDVYRAQRFDSGVPVLNDWLQKHAWPSHQGGGARVYVAVESTQDLIAAYFCLSAAQADRAAVPSRVSQGMGQSPIPVVLIGRFGVDMSFQGTGLGTFMVRQAFEETLKTAQLIGVRAVMVDAKDQDAADFYDRLGFTASVNDPLRLFIMIKDVRRSLAATATP
jgi:GNAT superfamily N-acetyltransferase